MQTEWDSFLESVDGRLQMDSQAADGKLAESLSPDIPLTDGRSAK